MSKHDLARLLEDRAKTHGDFDVVAAFARPVKDAIRHHGAYKMTRGQLEALDMIAVKIARIVAGDPDWPDHWNDIAGYAMLGKKAHK